MAFHCEPRESGLPAEPERERSSPGFSRRNFLIGTGAAAGAAFVAARLGVAGAAMAHEGDGDHSLALEAWAVTRRRGRYLALAGDAMAPQIRELDTGLGGEVSLAASAGIALPATLTAMALHASGDRLLVAGAEASGEGLRPVLYDVSGGAPREVAFDAGLVFGVATAIAANSARDLAVLIEGSEDAEQMYNAVTRVATSRDGGESWAIATLAADLGEGYPGHLIGTGRQWYAVTVDGAGQRRGHLAATEGSWQSAAPPGAGGEGLAVTSLGSSGAEALDYSGEVVGRLRWSPATGTWREAGTVDIGQRVLAVVPVSGVAGQFIVIGSSSAHLVGEG